MHKSVFNVDVDLISAGGVVSVGVSVLMWVWVAEPSGVDVTTMLMEVLEITRVSLTSTNCDKQSASLLKVPDIHSKVMLYVASSSENLFTLLFYHLEIVVEVCGCCAQQCQIHVYSSSTL